MMKPSKAQAKDRIQRGLDAIPELMSIHRSSQEFTKWHRNTKIAIEYTFGEDSQHVETFTRIRYSLGIISGGIPEYEFQEAYVNGLQRAQAILESMLDEIEEYWPDNAQPQTVNGQPSVSEQIATNRVFVVHGRDDRAREAVARFLERLELEPIILQEQPNEGRTIVEKFEEYAQVGFAVVLCTPDDVGALEIERDELKPRPRQNVVFEWGFFLGKIGRNRVCALYKEGVEIPSDYAGVVYIPLDDIGRWQMPLAVELQAAGLPVDLNRLGRRQSG